MDASAGDDAAVYRLDDERALVATVDFFTPIVDDPYDFGRIAATNALSDLYAKGARPLFALNILGFPRPLLGAGLLEEIIRGGGMVARDAGIAVIGGHSVDAEEPSYGLCAIGMVDIAVLRRNSTARPGDRLVLTKPIGTGVIATALKAGTAPRSAVDAAIVSMTTLNRGASEAMLRVGVNAATDVTGYGLLGHLRQLLGASGVAATVRASAVPLLEGARELAQAGAVPGGTRRNLEDLHGDLVWEADLSEADRLLLCDAQTSGGLLLSVPAERLDALLEALRAAGAPAAAVVGEVAAGEPGRITVSR